MERLAVSARKGDLHELSRPFSNLSYKQLEQLKKLARDPELARVLRKQCRRELTQFNIDNSKREKHKENPLSMMERVTKAWKNLVEITKQAYPALITYGAAEVISSDWTQRLVQRFVHNVSTAQTATAVMKAVAESATVIATAFRLVPTAKSVFTVYHEVSGDIKQEKQRASEKKAAKKAKHLETAVHELSEIIRGAHIERKPTNPIAREERQESALGVYYN